MKVIVLRDGGMEDRKQSEERKKGRRGEEAVTL